MSFYIHELVPYSVQGSDLGQCCTEFIMGKCLTVYTLETSYTYTLLLYFPVNGVLTIFDCTCALLLCQNG